MLSTTEFRGYFNIYVILLARDILSRFLLIPCGEIENNLQELKPKSRFYIQSPFSVNYPYQLIIHVRQKGENHDLVNPLRRDAFIYMYSRLPVDRECPSQVEPTYTSVSTS